MKQILFLFLVCIASSAALAGGKPSFLEIARDSDGKVKYIDQFEAAKFCGNLGAHLPSVRELAMYAASFGAKGIVTEDECGMDHQCSLIRARNVDGSADSFYFSSSGYQRPASEVGKNWFWSSSSLYSTNDYAFAFGGYNGDIDYDSGGNYSHAILCAANR